MQIIISIFLLVLCLILLPITLGTSFETAFDSVKMKEGLYIPRCWAMGLATMLALFQIVAVPIIIVGLSFHVLLIAWTVSLILYECIFVFSKRKELIASISKKVTVFWDNFVSAEREQRILWILFVLLVIFETCLLIFRTHMDTDDARFIAEAMEAYEQDSLLRIHPINGNYLDFPIGEMIKDVTSPYPLFIAAIAKITFIHPAVMAHAIFPVLLIPLSFMVAYLIADFLLVDSRKIAIFMILLAVIVLFSFESVFSWGYTMLAIIWQGRSISAVIMLPLLWYVLLHIMCQEKIVKGLYGALIIVALANVDLSGMGGVMGPLIGGTFALAYLVTRRKVLPAMLIGVSVLPAGLYMIVYKICNIMF